MGNDNQQEKIPLASELPKADNIPEETIKNESKPEIIDLTQTSRDSSHLPSGVQASLQLDRKLSQENQTDKIVNETKAANNKVTGGVLKKDFSKKFFKITLGFFIVFVVCFLAFLLITATKLDTKFIKIKNIFIIDLPGTQHYKIIVFRFPKSCGT